MSQKHQDCSRERLPLSVFVLGLTVFSLGTTEFMVAGLLPELSSAFDVSTSQVGMLITVFALGVAIGAPLITAATTRVPRKTALIGLLAVFIVGEFVAAVAPTFSILVVARIVTAVAHGAFFGIGAVVAADLVSPQRRARAIAVMFGGLTIATVAGVPLGTMIGQQIGWRATFAAVAVLGIVDLIGVAILVPARHRGHVTRLRDELVAFTKPRLWLALGTTMLSQAGLYAAYTYLAPLLIEDVGFDAETVPWLLMVFGVGTLLGTLVGGRLADRALMLTLTSGLAVLATVLVLITPASQVRVGMVVALLAFGVAAFLINPALQTQVLNQAPDAPTLASTVNISAFNVGNAVGPLVAGLGLTAGLGNHAPSWFGSVFVLAAFVLALITVRIKPPRRNQEKN